tara:strand:- start:3090 stop:3410 length:321 start_codon:yes stop_codon:yes gene_type:complete
MSKNSRLVYSTDKSRIDEKIRPDFVCQKDQLISLKLDKKSRRGKTVTVATGFRLPDKELKILAKALRKKCSTGGTFDKDTIELQGNFLEKTALELKANNFSVKILE